MINNFTIYGERCSGTNFLENAMTENFNLEITWNYGFKHFFGHNNLINSDDTLFIGIVRNPYDWIDSFYNEKHNLPEENKNNINSFLYNEFYSVSTDENKLEENIKDRNFKNDNKRYKNIFECRKVKNNFLIYDMPNLVKNYIFIKYEDLRDNYNNILDYIFNKYSLVKKFSLYKTIEIHKKEQNKLFKIKENKLPIDIINIISENIDYEQEKLLGYIK
jgi:hypothetical protein